jgi:flagellar motility protein MotE (MotC chaperone)
MNTVKGWINKVRPGTFEIEDSSSNAERKNHKQFSESEMKVLTALAKREEELKRKEALYEQRAKELKSLSQQIEQKLDKMRKMTADFERRRLYRKEMDEKDISRMVKYYETMDPEKIAVFLNKMDRITAMHIIMRMGPRKASAVMELLDPEVAVDITERVTRFKKDRIDVSQTQ